MTMQIPFKNLTDKCTIKAVNFINGVPFIVFTQPNGQYGKQKAPKSYFESLGLTDNTDEFGSEV